jgi:hypothetical protein
VTSDVAGKSPPRTHDVWTSSHVGQEDILKKNYNSSTFYDDQLLSRSIVSICRVYGDDVYDRHSLAIGRS